MVTPEDIRQAVLSNQLIITEHVLVRMMQRSVRAPEIAEVLLKGAVDDWKHNATPFPTCRFSYTLLNSKRLCAVVGYDGDLKQAHIITVYWDS